MGRHRPLATTRTGDHTTVRVSSEYCKRQKAGAIRQDRVAEADEVPTFMTEYLASPRASHILSTLSGLKLRLPIELKRAKCINQLEPRFPPDCKSGF